MSLVQKGRWITLVALVCHGAVYVRALAFTPVERLQGPAQKIFYLNVPAALWTEADATRERFFLALAGKVAWFTGHIPC